MRDLILIVVMLVLMSAALSACGPDPDRNKFFQPGWFYEKLARQAP